MPKAEKIDISRIRKHKNIPAAAAARSRPADANLPARKNLYPARKDIYPGKRSTGGMVHLPEKRSLRTKVEIKQASKSVDKKTKKLKFKKAASIAGKALGITGQKAQDKAIKTTSKAVAKGILKAPFRALTPIGRIESALIIGKAAVEGAKAVGSKLRERRIKAHTKAKYGTIEKATKTRRSLTGRR